MKLKKKYKLLRCRMIALRNELVMMGASLLRAEECLQITHNGVAKLLDMHGYELHLKQPGKAHEGHAVVHPTCVEIRDACLRAIERGAYDQLSVVIDEMRDELQRRRDELQRRCAKKTVQEAPPAQEAASPKPKSKEQPAP